MKTRKLGKPRKLKLTQTENLARIDWNIKDATEALRNAVGMRDWSGVKKYTGQIETLEKQRIKAEATTNWRKLASSMNVGHRAGDYFGRGFKGEHSPWKSLPKK